MEPVTITAKILGSGSFGCVRLGTWRGKQCAVKILQEDQARNSKAKQRFENERRILKRLKHPNIVGQFEVFLPAETFVLVLELLMTTLRDYLGLTGEGAPQPLQAIPFYRKVDLSSDVASGIRYLHSLSPRVLHRDLSDTNVLVSRNHRAKICDFGMAREVERAPPPPHELTPDPGVSPYMPPEARCSKPRYCTGIDVFSCGVLMLEIRVQKTPNPLPEREMSRPSFATRQLPKIIREVVRRQEHLRLLSPDDPLREIITQCLCDTQEKRPTAHDLCVRLEQAKADPKYGKSYSLEDEYLEDDETCDDLKHQLECSREEARKLQAENEELVAECDYLKNELEFHQTKQLAVATALRPPQRYASPTSDFASAMGSARSSPFPPRSLHSGSDCSMLVSRPSRRRNTLPTYVGVSQESNHSKSSVRKPVILLSQESKPSLDLSQESSYQIKRSLSLRSSSPRPVISQVLSQDTSPVVHRRNDHVYHTNDTSHLLPSTAAISLSQSDTVPFTSSPYQKQSFFTPQQQSSNYWGNSQESEWYVSARPVMLVGPLDEAIKETLLDKFPDRFCCCIPFTTAPLHPGDEKLYHHISREKMEHLSAKGVFALLSRSDGHYYGITFSDILLHMQEGVHCLLPESIGLVLNLHKRNISPIVISIIPSSAQVFVNMSPHCEPHLEQKEAFQLLGSAIETNREFQGLLTDVVHGNSFGEIYQKIKTTIIHSGSNHDDVYCSV